ncbi:MAG TPA: hypothetical protein VFF01_08060 [Candidatus Deferrimicrobiaceae bacterium]|nr:hypothetical protein [Candidatus Deferrimicrobiaceae bacterium]
MTPMILYCGSCRTQNFVSEERSTVAEPPPRCWKCGEPLPHADETGFGAGESNKHDRPIMPFRENGE